MANLEPPRIAFAYRQAERLIERSRACSSDELRAFLVAMDVIEVQQKWPPRELVVSLAGSYPSEKLTKFGLV